MWDRIMLRKRYIIECINELLKNKANMVHSRNQSIHNFVMNLCSALTAYCFLGNKPEALPVYMKSSRKFVCVLNLSRTGVSNKPTMEDVWDRNGFVSLFANTEKPLWGFAPDRTIESKMEMMFAYSPIHSDYKVIRINSYKEFEPYRRLGKEWCISDGEDIFNVYAEDGKNTLFLLKRKDAHKVKREIGEGFPKDDYGMSFIAVFVSDTGRILSTTSRWNALDEKDQLLTIGELKQLLGPDFSKLK